MPLRAESVGSRRAGYWATGLPERLFVHFAHPVACATLQVSLARSTALTHPHTCSRAHGNKSNRVGTIDAFSCVLFLVIVLVLVLGLYQQGLQHYVASPIMIFHVFQCICIGFYWKIVLFNDFNSCVTDGQTDGWMDGPTDGQTHIEMLFCLQFLLIPGNSWWDRSSRRLLFQQKDILFLRAVPNHSSLL